MIHHKLFAQQPIEDPQKSVQVWRHVNMDGIEAKPQQNVKRNHKGHDEAIGKLPRVSDHASELKRSRIAIDPDVFDDLKFVAEIFGSRADHGNVMSRVAECDRFEHHSRVFWITSVFQNHQDSSWIFGFHFNFSHSPSQKLGDR